MPVADNIERKLAAGLAPLRLTVIDQSHLHAGHAGARPGGESHFRVEIVAAKFRGMNRLARQREVHRHPGRRARRPRPCLVDRGADAGGSRRGLAHAREKWASYFAQAGLT